LRCNHDERHESLHFVHLCWPEQSLRQRGIYWWAVIIRIVSLLMRSIFFLSMYNKKLLLWRMNLPQ
jgi:uncharacterized membrane protein